MHRCAIDGRKLNVGRRTDLIRYAEQNMTTRMGRDTICLTKEWIGGLARWLCFDFTANQFHIARFDTSYGEMSFESFIVSFKPRQIITITATLNNNNSEPLIKANEMLNQKLREMTSIVESYKGTNARLNSRLDIIETERVGLLEERRLQYDKIENQKRQIAQVITAHSTTMKKRDGLEAEVQRLTDLVSIAQRDYSKLHNESTSKLAAQAKAIEDLGAINRQISNDKAGTQNINEALKNENASLKRDLGQAERDLRDHEVSIKTLQQVRDRLINASQSVHENAKKQANDAARTMIDNMARDLADRHNEVRELKHNFAQLKCKHDCVTKQFHEQMDKFIEANTRLYHLEMAKEVDSKQTISKLHADLNQARQQRDASAMKTAMLNTQHQMLTDTFNRMVAENRDLQAQVIKITQENEDWMNRYAEGWNDACLKMISIAIAEPIKP